MGVTKSVLLDHRVSECNEILTGWSQAKINRIVTGTFRKNNLYAFYHHKCKRKQYYFYGNLTFFRKTYVIVAITKISKNPRENPNKILL